MPSGYYRFPTIAGNDIVFASEDDLWTVSASGGIPRRLTSGLAEATRPLLSPDGVHLAFAGQEEGQLEIYLTRAVGGPVRRLTFMGGVLCYPVAWTPEGKIVFASSAKEPFPAQTFLYSLSLDDNSPQRLNFGPARAISFGSRGAVVLGRNTADPARWKRYRGGTAGQLWIDQNGDGDFHPLLDLKGNFGSPMWIGTRIFFVSDHEGIGNIYSCLPSGGDLRRHTDHDQFYARNPSTDGRRIVYHAGADLYLLDPATNDNHLVPIEFYSPQTQRNRKFVDAKKYLQDAELNPNGESLAVTTRGKLFTFSNWDGAVTLHSQNDGGRYRLPTWLPDSQRLVAVTDEGNEESLVILSADASVEQQHIEGIDTGRIVEMRASPKKDQVVFSNQRQEIMFLDLVTRSLRLIERGVARQIAGFDWSPDGAWIAYSVSTSLQVMALKLWQVDTAKSFELARPVLRDVAPSFDPLGRYLYFLSYRDFDPVYDNLHFDLNFPRGMRPFLITLRKDQVSPFARFKPPEGKNGSKTKEPEKQEETKPADQPVVIDLDGIQDRVMAFPVEEGLYGAVHGAKSGKVIYSRYPVEGSLAQPFPPPSEPPAKGTLYTYNFENLKEEQFVSDVSSFALSSDRSVLLYRAGNRLRVLKAGEKPDKEAGSSPSRASGWIDLDRIKVSVVPALEWKQMFREAWRLQRDQFWTPDMSQVDWLAVYDRYLPLVARVSSRSEFSDLLWEMQGELGTSHAYELGGDYRPRPEYWLGHLGADFEYDRNSDGWRIVRIVRGDPWDEHAHSPLAGPGVNVQVGDRITAINGRRLSRDFSPAMAIVNLAGTDVALTVMPAGESTNRTVTVKTLRSETPARYREWVEMNRARVRQATQGRVGYIHIPDMSPRGYAEFHRGYLAEIDREGLIVDVRFNGGGHVSPLILEKLARRRVGYDTSRWSQVPEPYPPESVFGPMVALTNEHAGSDGDIFSHGFKLLKLGPLLGKRTWGGVIGIWPRHTLVDGTVTTQPEFSFWFQDVGWGIENYGTDPDIEVDNRPQDYAHSVDAQLERAIQEITKLLDRNPPQIPMFDGRPSRAIPRLPKK